MEKKIFFIDFDGTLMRDDKTISDKNREALRNAVDQGHYIALATGRAVSSGRRIAKELGLTRPGCYLVAYNLRFFCRLYPEQQASANRVC